MRRLERKLLRLVVWVAVVLSAICGSRGSVSKPPIVSPPNEAVGPAIQAGIPPMQPSAAPDYSNTEHKWPRMISPSIESEAPNVPLGAVSSPPIRHPLGTPTVQPSLGRAPSVAPASRTISFHRPSISPKLASPIIPGKRYGMSVTPPPKEISSNISPANPSYLKGFSPAISPARNEVKKPSKGIHAPVASLPPPSRASPVISPVPHEGKKPSNITHASSASQLPSSRASPKISPAPHEVDKPTIITHAPTPSSGASPVISPVPQEVNKPPNITSTPLASQPPSSGASPVISPVPHEVKKPSNISRAPSASQPPMYGASPVISPVPHEVKKPSNITHAPLASRPPSSGASPVISPVPHEVNKPSNITRAPSASQLPPSTASPVISPVPHEVKKPSNVTHAPLASQPPRSLASPAMSPVAHEAKKPSNPTHAPLASHRHPPVGRLIQSPASAPFSPPSSYHPGSSLPPIQAPSHPPAVFPKNKQRHPAPPPYLPAPAPSPSSTISSRHKWPIQAPVISPSEPLSTKSRSPSPSPQPVWLLPPPPPNLVCRPLACQAPLTNPPPGPVCDCVLPIRVGLRLSVTLYTFFPLVSELAQEIASGIFMNQSQVRIMGANADSDDSGKTIVLIDLVPLGKSFDSTTPFMTYQKFWHKQVAIKASYFGDYDVLYVLYPGLPSSPPTAPADINVNNGEYGNNNNARTVRPLGVDVRKKKEKLSGSLIAIIVLSSVIALVLFVGAGWFLLLKHRESSCLPAPSSQTLLPTSMKTLGIAPATVRSLPSSTSASFSSSIQTYAASAKTFSLSEIERVTDRFNDSRIIGEGGFGRVYQGTLEDGTRVAIKVLKRDDQQGGREFLAEVEMLRRLHHRNLVKLIGICTEDHIRCLVYELIPNGSVESHLHGVDKETAPLDWNARIKIALGAARGLAYLHEDSSPRVIHRDFKSSNILLEHDFTPKVADFGLARTALDEGNEHISTRVMGTFGYVAPEYAMTGHLLVKSDVYSYGVVLLELLTGRKPVDMSQPPGQENLVNWARPLLTSMDGLEMIIDPSLRTSISLDSVAKVAAIASMCVQPEVSHRPFMGEVVQALKLVSNEGDEYRPSCSQDESSTKDADVRLSTGVDLEEERVISESDIFCTSARFTRDASGSFRRHSSSGPLTTGRNGQFWQRARGFSSGSMIDHDVTLRLGLEDTEQWP